MAEFIEISRIFNDRFIVTSQPDRLLFKRKAFYEEFFLRILSWFYSPSFYQEENRKAIACFEKYLIQQLGAPRLQRICCRYHLDFASMKEQGSPLVSRDIAKIIVGSSDATVEDLEDLIQKAKDPLASWPFSQELKEALQKASSFSDLSTETFAQAKSALEKALNLGLNVQKIQGRLTGKASEQLACYFFDSFLNDWEKLHFFDDYPSSSFEDFVHHLSAIGVKREMEVGMLIPGPSASKHLHYYYVAGKLITGEGMVSYMLVPATKDTPLPPLRVFRGTAFRPSEIDALSSMITDCENKLGLRAYQSGEKYEALIERYLPPIEIEAGHSLGSTITQYRVARLFPKIKKAYLFNGPGLPKEEVRLFNQKARAEGSPVELVIRDAMGDIFLEVGERHLGYKAPRNVKRNYRIYKPPFQAVPGTGPHFLVWGLESGVYFGLAGGFSKKQIDGHLHRENLSCRERIRKIVGPILAALLSGARTLIRRFFETRAIQHLGLSLGYLDRGKWTRKHFTPLEAAQPL